MLEEKLVIAADTGEPAALVWLAQDKGFFADFGLDVEVTPHSAGKLAVDAQLFCSGGPTNHAVCGGDINRRILQPIRLQEREIARVTDTNLSYQLTLTHQDEISSLSDSLKLMIQQRREAETDLQSANETLQAANKELESFAYIASHDLKAPLRGIKSLVSLLTRELGEDLSPDAKRYVDSKLVDEIRTFIDTGGQWTIINGDNLPRLTTQRAPFELVLRNLLDNAIKHHDRESGTIRIDARTVAERYEFTVSDDGPGIAPEYQERIFQIFHTLKPRDEVEGSGLGLALVQKTVEHFGGSIRVESDPERERGAKFIFT